jgi:hypothetical protein
MSDDNWKHLIIRRCPTARTKEIPLFFLLELEAVITDEGHGDGVWKMCCPEY